MSNFCDEEELFCTTCLDKLQLHEWCIQVLTTLKWFEEQIKQKSVLARQDECP